ncbi:MAG: metal ABC transporter permease [Pseudomonadota bacterium]
MIDTLIVPWQFGFMRQALVISLLIAIPAGLLSCFLVLRGWSLMGDAISHAVLPGVVLAYIIGWSYAIGAFAAGMICAILTGYLAQRSRIKQDTIIGIVFSGMFALGIVLYIEIQTDIHLDHILFGDILGVNDVDIILTGFICLCVAGGILLRLRDLMLHTFDPMQAKISGLPVGVLHYGLLVGIALTVVAALKAAGIILTIGLLIAPGALAFLLTRRFGIMLFLAVIISVASCIAGLYASFYIDSAPAPTIVLLMAIFFIIVFCFTLYKNRHLGSVDGL